MSSLLSLMSTVCVSLQKQLMQPIPKLYLNHKTCWRSCPDWNDHKEHYRRQTQGCAEDFDTPSAHLAVGDQRPVDCVSAVSCSAQQNIDVTQQTTNTPWHCGLDKPGNQTNQWAHGYLLCLFADGSDRPPRTGRANHRFYLHRRFFGTMTAAEAFSEITKMAAAGWCRIYFGD